uniref:Ig-like domain-containing protein n=1 Tax=Poecilia mexicana TaxID=48701 RepID=A0A3B3XEE0_9TELE
PLLKLFVGTWCLTMGRCTLTMLASQRKVITLAMHRTNLTVTLQCNVKGDPVPVVTWMSPKNTPISNAIDRYKVLKDGTLVVQKVQQFDEGNYTCMARNSVGQDNKVTRVEVLATPLVINGLRGTSNTIKVNAVQGERKLLDCVTEGTPSPRIMWILPGNVILPAPYYSNHMTVHQNGTLEIQSTKKTDSGQMVCVARYEGGEVRMLVNLDVKEMLGSPQIAAPKRESFSLKVGNTVTLNCSIDAGTRISNNPSVADAGMYRCVGHTSAGTFESTVTLSPGRKPQILNRYISPVSIMDGETLFLHCQTTGEPFRLTWTLPSGVVLNRLQKVGQQKLTTKHHEEHKECREPELSKIGIQKDDLE